MIFFFLNNEFQMKNKIESSVQNMIHALLVTETSGRDFLRWLFAARHRTSQDFLFCFLKKR